MNNFNKVNDFFASFGNFNEQRFMNDKEKYKYMKLNIDKKFLTEIKNIYENLIKDIYKINVNDISEYIFNENMDLKFIYNELNCFVEFYKKNENYKINDKILNSSKLKKSSNKEKIIKFLYKISLCLKIYLIEKKFDLTNYYEYFYNSILDFDNKNLENLYNKINDITNKDNKSYNVPWFQNILQHEINNYDVYLHLNSVIDDYVINNLK